MPPNERSMLPKDCALITRTLVMTRGNHPAAIIPSCTIQTRRPAHSSTTLTTTLTVIRERTYNMFGLSKGWKLLHESCPKCDKERKTRQQAAPPATPAPCVKRVRFPAPERAPATTARSAPTRPTAPPEFKAASSAATPQATEVQEAVPAQPAMMDVMLSTTRDGHFADVRGDDSNARS